MDRYSIDRDGNRLTENRYAENNSPRDFPSIEYVGLLHPSDRNSLFMTRGTMNILPYIFGMYHGEDTSDDIYDFKANATAALLYIADRYDMEDDHDAQHDAWLAPFIEQEEETQT
ncbi:Uncharacterised protein [Mycobacteroides abscessus subsp. abscessus]|nr:Uncharacterised protein [Mycobacteroides abscessus subsp. abscessus]